MSYDDIVAAQKKRDAKDAGRIRKLTNLAPSPGHGSGSRSRELEKAEEQIKFLGVAKYCSVLQF